MFSFLGKKDGGRKIIDRVFISTQAKHNAIIENLRNQNNNTVICWFDDSYEQMQALVQANNLNADIYMARENLPHNTVTKPVLFIEHYPLSSKEKELFEKLQIREAVFYSSLDEPLFKHFGGNKIVSLMEKMGLSENEAIEHPMISAAIKNAQEKIADSITIEHSALSQADWFSKNIVK